MLAQYQMSKISHTLSLGDLARRCVLRAADTTHANEDDAEIIARTNKRARDRETDTCLDWKGTKVSNDLSRHHNGAVCFVTSFRPHSGSPLLPALLISDPLR